ncbi:siderophore-interacting protein [Actinomadura sp. BRA 177]|nr:siderophore-interacting protein [Actinomadura sp. BRA 177]
MAPAQPLPTPGPPGPNRHHPLAPPCTAVQPGDEIRFTGPGGGYVPDPAADWHLLAGDESALPAIAASITWLHRNGASAGAALVRAVADLDFPPGTVQAFVHGEAGFVKHLRHLLRTERGVPRDRLSVSGYWRLGHDEDGWQAIKRDWNRQVEAEQDGTGPGIGTFPCPHARPE